MPTKDVGIWYKAGMVEDISNSVTRKLVCVSLVCVTFITVEITGGIISNSLAILGDAAHLLSDLFGFIISIFAVKLATGNATKKLTFGYHRAEILGALVNVLFILVLSGVLLYTGLLRILYPPTDLDADFMLYTALFGLVCN